MLRYIARIPARREGLANKKDVKDGGIAAEEALKNGMEEKSREFTKQGSELYAKA